VVVVQGVRQVGKTTLVSDVVDRVGGRQRSKPTRKTRTL